MLFMNIKMRHISRSANNLHRLFHSYSNQPVVANRVTGLNAKDVGPTSINIYNDITRHHLHNSQPILTMECRQK